MSSWKTSTASAWWLSQARLQWSHDDVVVENAEPDALFAADL